MDKYPVFREEQAVGELTVAPDALYTAFSVSCRGQEGLWCAWAVGERESLRIGVLEPENGCLQIRRRFSRQPGSSSGSAPSRAAMDAVIRSSSSRAARPAEWAELGLPGKASSVRQNRSTTPGSAGWLAA